MVLSPEFKKYFANTSWLMGERILRMIVGLFVGIWIARYLGPEKFGLLSYAQSFVGLFTTIATLGLDGIIIRELVKDESQRDVLLGTAFVLKLIGAVVVLFILAVAVQFTNNNYFTNLLIFIIASAIIFQSFNVIDFYFQSKVLSKFVVFANFISLFLSSIVKIGLILNNAPLIAFALVILFDSIVLSVGFIYFYKKQKFRIKQWKFNSVKARELLKDSWPLILSGVVISIYMKIDQVMIKEILDSKAVGQYAAAVKLSEAWYFIPGVFSGSLFPAIVNFKKINEKLYNQLLQKLYNLMVWIAVVIALPITFLSHWIVQLLYGEAYTSAADVLSIHIWTGIFVFLGVASGKWFLSENLQIFSFYRTFVGAIINIILNIILIKKYGIYGAAMATLTAQIFATYIFDMLNARTRNMFWMKTKAFIYPIKIGMDKLCLRK